MDVQQRGALRALQRAFGRDGAASRTLAFLTLGWLLALAASPVAATPITIGAGGLSPFEVDPLYMIPPTPENPNPLGLVGPGNGVAFTVGPEDFAITACEAGQGCDLSISASLITPVYQNPQFPSDSQNPQTPQGTPTPSVPFVADSEWTVQNTSGVALANAWLLFTSVDFTKGYPDIALALDQNLYQVVRVPDASGDAFYGALALGSLAPEASKVLRVRYIVAEDLQVGATLVMPPLGVSGLIVVPEPVPFVLLALGLAALAWARRPRWD